MIRIAKGKRRVKKEPEIASREVGGYPLYMACYYKDYSKKCGVSSALFIQGESYLD